MNCCNHQPLMPYRPYTPIQPQTLKPLDIDNDFYIGDIIEPSITGGKWDYGTTTFSVEPAAIETVKAMLAEYNKLKTRASCVTCEGHLSIEESSRYIALKHMLKEVGLE